MTRKPRIGVFHPGTQHSWQTALAFQEAGMLGWYATSVFYDPARWPYRIERILPGGLRQRLNAQFRRRYTAALDPAKVRHLDPVEWLETVASRLDLQRLSGWLNRLGNSNFGRAVARLCEREPVDLLWGYDTAALELFEWAKPRGIPCVLDRTIAHPHHTARMMAAAYRRHPEFFSTPYVAPSAALVALQDRELSLADQVVVGSAMCARTLIEAGCAAEKIHIVPYGFDEARFPSTRPNRRSIVGRPLRFLFVGQIGVRKGVPDLLKAFAAIAPRHASLDLVGPRGVPNAALAPYAERVSFHPPVGRDVVAGFYAEADCFVFPSLSEGSAIVLAEAVGAGLGIVQTCWGGEGAEHGRSGIVIDDADQLPQALDQVLSNPSVVEAWQAAAWARAPERRWSEYRAKAAALAAEWAAA